MASDLLKVAIVHKDREPEPARASGEVRFELYEYTRAIWQPSPDGLVLTDLYTWRKNEPVVVECSPS
jgi:hypothetical protein